MNQKVVVLATLVLATAIFLGFLFSNYNKRAATEKFYTSVGNPYEMIETAPRPAGMEAYTVPTSVATNAAINPDLAAGQGDVVAPSDPFGDEVFNSVKSADGAVAAVAPGCFPRDRLTADDLLPKDASNSLWAQVNPAGQGDVKDQNFLNAGHLVGVNTIGQSLRNANLQLRSEPANPQMAVSPWNISTIEPDLNRRPLEIGSSA